jgi:outer membrane lipoprotein LolB
MIFNRYNPFMKITQYKFLTIFLVCLWLTGCASFQPFQREMKPAVDQDMAWNDRVQMLSQIKNWDLKALIAIRNTKDNQSATLNWQQTKQNYEISLFGPLGSNAVTLTGQPGKVILATADGKKIVAANPESLLATQTGWQLPVSNLYYWIRGLPAPNSPSRKQFDAYHHLMILHQQGWIIRYQHYVSFKGIDVPSRIVLENSQLSVKIVINQWQF